MFSDSESDGELDGGGELGGESLGELGALGGDGGLGIDGGLGGEGGPEDPPEGIGIDGPGGLGGDGGPDEPVPVAQAAKNTNKTAPPNDLIIFFSIISLIFSSKSFYTF